MTAVILDTKELWQTVVAALVAGVGVTACFSLIILGVARFGELRRADRPVLAAIVGGLAGLALAATLAGITLGVIVMLSK